MKKKPVLFKKVCHTTCYKFNTMWNPGETYEGEEDPGKHFSDRGVPKPELPPDDAGMDPRSTGEIRHILKTKYNSTKPGTWTRRKLWTALRDFEEAEARDESTNPSDGVTRPGRKKGK